MIDIEKLRELCKSKSIRPTRHALIRAFQRNITLDEIEYALMNGEIIEQYADDYPYPSCLMLCIEQQPLHVVCAIANEEIWIITAYRPETDKWEKDFKTRKEDVK